MTKTALTPEETLRVAVAHHLDGIDQHKIASLFGINSGRIAEACVAIKYAMEHSRDIYQVATGKKLLVQNMTDKLREERETYALTHPTNILVVDTENFAQGGLRSVTFNAK